MLSLFLITPLCHSDDWHYCIIDDGVTSDIEVDSQDIPHIIYGGLTHAYYDGDEWIYEDIEGADGGGIPSIEFDDQYRLHISYCKFEDNFNLYYSYYTGVEWNSELVDDSDNSGNSNSIAVDSNGYPHIVYTHSGDGCVLKYAYKDVTGWNYEVVDDEYDVQGSECSLVLDSNDHPHISYKQKQPDYPYDFYITYAYHNGDSWQIETVEENDVDEGNNSIVVDSNDDPHIAYWDGHQDHTLKYAYNDGTGWSIEDIDYCNGDVSMSLDSFDYPHIAYNYNEMDIRYASLNETYWEIEDTVVCGVCGQLCVSLDLDSDDNPHISCDEFIEIDVGYIWYGDPLPEINLTTFTAEPQKDSIALNWSVETTEGEHISGFNLYRRELGLKDETLTPVRTDDNPSVDVDTNWTKINSSLITGSNPYSYIDATVESGTTYEYELEAVVEETPETLGTTTGRCGLPTSFEIISLHPNPTTDEVNITLSTPETTEVRIEVYDITGRLVISGDVGEVGVGDHTEVLSTNELKSGVYTVKAVFTGRDACATKRMVVVR